MLLSVVIAFEFWILSVVVNWPPAETLVEQCGKLKLLERLLIRLKERGHKVLSDVFFIEWAKICSVVLNNCIIIWLDPAGAYLFSDDKSSRYFGVLLRTKRV
jgi:hypothetical protein